MLCNISQNAMRQRGGYPGQVPPQGYPGQVPGGVPGSGTPPGGLPGSGTPPGGLPGSGTPPRGGTRVGQQKEYSLHGGRYASCVHAGGLSCIYHSFGLLSLLYGSNNSCTLIDLKRSLVFPGYSQIRQALTQGSHGTGKTVTIPSLNLYICTQTMAFDLNALIPSNMYGINVIILT